MSVPPIKVFSSRDFKHYRPVVGSPVAAIAHRFYSFITSTNVASAHARYAYATSYLGHEPQAGQPYVGSPLDEEVRQMLCQPPVIVLSQGPMHPWGLFLPEKEAERQSIRSSISETSSAPGIVVEPVSAIFLPWTVHQALKDAIDGGEQEEKSVAAFFILAGIVHETAHWIAANRHGYKHDPSRDASRTSTSPTVDFGKAKIVQHSRRDWGTHAKELLLGFAYTFVSYADGTHEVVCQRVAPVIPKLRPALDKPSQSALIGGPLPSIIDISKYGAPNLREVPKWRPKSDFLIVSCMSPDHSCHHGACRLRDS